MSEFFEQLTDETDRAFQAFVAYRELPPASRSIRNSVSVEMGRGPEWDPLAATEKQRAKHAALKRTREEWSSANLWVERARAWDVQQAALRVARRADAVDEMIERHAEIGRILQGEALEAIERLRNEGAVPVDRDGQAKGTAITRGFLGNAREVIRALDTGCRIERAAYGIMEQPDDDPAVEQIPAIPARKLFESSPAVAAAMANVLVANRAAERAAAAGR